MKVEEIMTRDVITVRADTPIHAAARLMVDHGVSGLPVVDEGGAVVGILSEGDLILRQKPRERLPWWRLFFADGERLAREYQKAAGTTVREVMTRSVVCVDPALPIESAAAIIDQRGIRRLPVVDDGQLVGIVSRGDLIKALAAAPAWAGVSLTDAALEREMKDRLAREPWASRGILIQATGGVLRLSGLVASETEKSALETMARAIEGCKGVESDLAIEAGKPYHYGYGI
jgi:CBS domain-containing protein